MLDALAPAIADLLRMGNARRDWLISSLGHGGIRKMKTGLFALSVLAVSLGAASLVTAKAQEAPPSPDATPEPVLTPPE